MKCRQGLPARKADAVRVALPITVAVPFDELVERDAVAVDAGVVLTEAVDHLDRQVPERRRDDLGCFSRTRELAADEHVGADIGSISPAVAQPSGLKTAER